MSVQGNAVRDLVTFLREQTGLEDKVFLFRALSAADFPAWLGRVGEAMKRPGPAGDHAALDAAWEELPALLERHWDGAESDHAAERFLDAMGDQ